MVETTSLPTDWHVCTLGDLLTGIQTGKSVRCDERPPSGGEKGLVKISAVTWGEFDESQSKTLLSDEHLLPSHKVEIGDLLISRANTLELVGACVLVKTLTKQLYLSDKVLRLEMNESFKSYVLRYLKTREARAQIESLATGNQLSMRNISQDALRAIRLPFPALAEQKAIADKLDTLLAQVETTKARLERIPDLLKRFRQSVLAAAVSGRLTEDWRSTARVTSVREQLELWAIEREDLKSRKLLKSSAGPKSEPPSLGILIPNSWAWITFDHIAEHSSNALKAGPFGSALKKIDCVDQGYKVYGQEQVISGDEKLATYCVDQVKYDQLQACAVRPGDILISLVGTIGKILVLSESAAPGIINPRLVKLSLQREINRRYTQLFLESPIAHGFFRGFSHGGTMEILNLGILKELPIALPPQEEQTEIVRRVDQLFAHADRIEQQAQAALERVNKLTQSILAKAFRGGLTEQWRRDHPELISGENSAAALLERIKAERAAGTPSKRRKSGAS